MVLPGSDVEVFGMGPRIENRRSSDGSDLKHIAKREERHVKAMARREELHTCCHAAPWPGAMPALCNTMSPWRSRAESLWDKRNQPQGSGPPSPSQTMDLSNYSRLEDGACHAKRRERHIAVCRRSPWEQVTYSGDHYWASSSCRSKVMERMDRESPTNSTWMSRTPMRKSVQNKVEKYSGDRVNLSPNNRLKKLTRSISTPPHTPHYATLFTQTAIETSDLDAMINTSWNPSLSHGEERLFGDTRMTLGTSPERDVKTACTSDREIAGILTTAVTEIRESIELNNDALKAAIENYERFQNVYDGSVERKDHMSDIDAPFLSSTGSSRTFSKEEGLSHESLQARFDATMKSSQDSLEARISDLSRQASPAVTATTEADYTMDTVAF